MTFWTEPYACVWKSDIRLSSERDNACAGRRHIVRLIRTAYGNTLKMFSREWGVEGSLQTFARIFLYYVTNQEVHTSKIYFVVSYFCWLTCFRRFCNHHRCVIRIQAIYKYIRQMYKMYFCTVCILVWHPDDGDRRDRNVSVNSGIW